MTEHPTLAEALVAALADVAVITKGRTANAGSYTYDYADLGDTVKEIQPRLAEHGIRVLTPVHGFEDRLACTVTLLHASGDSMSFPPLPFPYGRDAQATGSMMTYYRRYALTAALGLGTADDDGAGAHAAPPVPGFRSSLTNAIAGLTDVEREVLRGWVAEQGLPDRPSLMNQEQAEKVVEFILHGLPQVEDTPTGEEE